MKKATKPATEGSHIQYRLARIVVKKFSESGSDLPDDGNADVGYEISIGADLVEDDSTVGIGIKLRAFLSMDEEEEGEGETVAELESISTFKFNSLDLLKNEEGHIRVPRILLANLVGMALGTARGLLIGRSRNADLGKYPLPAVSPAEFIDDIVEGNSLSWVAEK